MTSNQADEIVGAFSVPFAYRVIFTEGVLNPDNPVLAEVLAGAAPAPARAVAFVDGGLARADPGLLPALLAYFQRHRDRLALAAPPQVVAGGEGSKLGLAGFEACVRALHEARLDRHSYAVAIGGGATLDTVGFAASSVHRGVRQVRLPTTVLGQNDAGIGVKNGIDYLGKKNFLGAFYPPHAVINDFALLRTLPPEHWRDGTAEGVKVGLIRDAAFFAWIEANAEPLSQRVERPMRQLIRRCAELHLRHIATGGDPFERGSARPLDFGHWSAHKLEQLSDYRLTHGHAVAVGMAVDVLYAGRIGLIEKDDAGRVLRVLKRLGFRLDVGASLGIRDADDCAVILQGLDEFQEHLGGALCVAMLRRIGQSLDVAEIDRATMQACVAEVLLGVEGFEPPTSSL